MSTTHLELEDACNLLASKTLKDEEISNVDVTHWEYGCRVTWSNPSNFSALILYRVNDDAIRLDASVWSYEDDEGMGEEFTLPDGTTVYYGTSNVVRGGFITDSAITDAIENIKLFRTTTLI